jgi:hypothetical protein
MCIINLNANYFYLRFVYFGSPSVGYACARNKNACIRYLTSGEYKTE